MKKSSGPAPKAIRTEDDLPMSVVVGGSIALVAIMFFFLQFKPVPGAYVGPLANLAASLLVVVFGFLFVTVSSRIVGLTAPTTPSSASSSPAWACSEPSA